MDTPAEHLIMNSCQYTPVYFIENPGTNQTRYVVAQNNHTPDKPVSENLKRFYENSGKLETNLTVADSASKPKVVKKSDANVIGNNLKLASFLIPKSETKIEGGKPVMTPVNNVLLKPVYIANNLTPVSAPKLGVNSKIVKLKDLPNVIRTQNGKILPKIKPKENSSSSKSKHTSVQLLKLGETYHSLNQLSDDQMKIVNHALKIFSSPQNIQPEPTYDPITNTKFIYKVVSPKDLAVVGKNKINKQKKIEIKKEIVKTVETEEEECDDELKFQLETKVTRSGRIVKLPRNILPETDEIPYKPKRKNGQAMTCYECCTKFNSVHRLHRHYETFPSHLPSRIHSDLFQCLVTIIKTSSLDGSSFVQHLDKFLKKLKSCIPCLLNGGKDIGQTSIINNNVGRFLGINPGRYKLNMEAFDCDKDKNGYCCHNPPPVTENAEIQLPIINNVRLIERHKEKTTSNPGSKAKTNIPVSLGIINNCQILNPICIEKVNIVNKVPSKIGLSRIVNNAQICIEKPNNVTSNTASIVINNTANNIVNNAASNIAGNNSASNIVINNTTSNIARNNSASSISGNIVANNIASNIAGNNAANNIARNNAGNNTASNIAASNIITDPLGNIVISKPTNILINTAASNIGINNTSNTPVTNTASNIEGNTIPVVQEKAPIFITKLENKRHTSEWPISNIDLKKIKLSPERESDTVLDDIVALLNDTNKTDHSVEPEKILDNVAICDNDKKDMPKPKSKPAHIQFRSAHFDIRSSPIKSSSTVFRKFQINPEKMAKFEVEVKRPIQLNKLAQEIEKCTKKTENKQEIIDNNSLQTSEQDNFILPKTWSEEQAENFKCNNLINGHTDDFFKSNSIEPALLHIKDNSSNVVLDNNEINANDISASQGQSIINFLESLGNDLSYSETASRNNSMDFQLDLFSFNNC